METFVAQMDLYAVIVMGFMLMVSTVGAGYALLYAGRFARQHFIWFRTTPVTLNTYCKSGSRMRVYALSSRKS